MIDWLSHLREIKGADTLQMVGKKLGLHPAYLSRLLRGERPISLRVKVAMVRVNPNLAPFYLQEALQNGERPGELLISQGHSADSPPSAPERGQEAVLRKEDT